ncbi:MAG: DUF6291 domain-containing protein, partial [Desulfovibrionaceae bacterium]|nr:DUF6291 domain-containing protein [Desulfovibrionaceae bacterium]
MSAYRDEMEDRSFAVFLDCAEGIDCLTDEQAGKLLKAMYTDHLSVDDNPEEEFSDENCIDDPEAEGYDQAVHLAFEMLTVRSSNYKIERREVSERRREAGRKGGRASAAARRGGAGGSGDGE